MRISALFLFAFATSAFAAQPIDCGKAHSSTERTICHTPALLQADARMTAYFEIATQLVPMGSRDHLRDAQVAFPQKRDACGTNRACIADAYRQQMVPLEEVIAGVKTHGPF